MDHLFHQAAFQAYAASVCIVSLTLYWLGASTAKTRNDRKVVLNREDVGVNAGSVVAEVEHPDVLRIKRAHLNLIESAVPFFAVGYLYCLTAPSATLARALFGTFVVVRVLHAVFYLAAKQPFRTITFAVGSGVNVVMIVQVFRALL